MYLIRDLCYCKLFHLLLLKIKDTCILKVIAYRISKISLRMKLLPVTSSLLMYLPVLDYGQDHQIHAINV